MSWQLLGRPKTLKVTRALAKQFAEMDPAPSDRPLSERRLAVYERVLKDGGFRPVTWATALCKEDGGVYRVNGKHTSTLLSGLQDKVYGPDEVPEFYAVLEEYECDTLEDVARLYATFDSKTQSRNANDIYLSFAGTVPELRELSHKTVCLAASGMSFHTGKEHLTAGERAELLLEHPEFVVWLSALFAGNREDRRDASSKHLQRQPVVAAVFASWEKSHQAADKFWAAVRDETGETPRLPDRKLARFLLTVGVMSGTGTHRVKSVQPREMYVKCLHAWNAWRKGENTDLRYYADSDVPAVK